MNHTTVTPPGHYLAAKRKVFIPHYPHDPAVGGEWYDIDLNGLVPSDSNLDELLRTVYAYHATLRWYLWVSDIVRRNVKRQRLSEYERTTGESRTFIERYVLPGDYDWTFWEGQYAWLDAQVTAIEKSLIPLLQTANANRRAEFQHQPPQL